MRFPGHTLRSPKEFEQWWGKVPKGQHELLSLQVERTEEYRYQVNLRVQWTPTGGSPLIFDQQWSVATDAERPRIQRYIVQQD